jgi:hypothetical protein
MCSYRSHFGSIIEDGWANANGCRCATRCLASCPEFVAFRNAWDEVWLVCEQKVQASTFLGEGIEGCAVLELYRRRQHGQSGQAYQHEKWCQSVELP